MKAEAILTSDSAEAQIHDLRQLIGERSVIDQVLREVQDWDAAHAATSDGAILMPRSRLLLTLLTYCYAVGIYSSEDIEWACENDAGATYICTNKPADQETIRQFRRANRIGIETCLTRVLSAGCRFPPPAAPHLPPLVSAHQKLEIAVMMDTAMYD